MTRLLKWRWAWELEEDNWSWRRLITRDSWLVYTRWDLLYLRKMKGIIHPLFPQRNHPGDSGKGWLGVLLCVSESSVPHRVTGSHQPTPTTTSGSEPLRASPCLPVLALSSGMYWVCMYHRLSKLAEHEGPFHQPLAQICELPFAIFSAEPSTEDTDGCWTHSGHPSSAEVKRELYYPHILGQWVSSQESERTSRSI